MIDYYEILEVHPKASQEIIKKAYLTLAKKYHPDTTTLDKAFAEQKIKQINEAYKVLSNEQLRSEYDRKRSTNSSGYSYSTGSGSQYSSQSNPIETSKNNLYSTFANYLHSLQTKIVKKDGYATQNNQQCKPLLDKFYKDTATDFKYLTDNNAFNGDIASAFVLTLWEFASCLTWCNDFIEADKLMNMAIKYVTPNDEFYSRFISARNNIRQSAKQQALYNQQSQSRKNTSYTDSGATDSSNPFLKIIGLIIACVVLYYGCAGGSTSKKNSSYNSRPSSSTSVNKNSSTKSASKQLVPRANIRTGYAPNAAILNNNGYCKLTIDNTRNSEPVYVRLWTTSPSRPVREFFIAARDSFTMQNLNPGSYELRYKYLYENREAEVGTKSETFQLTQTETYDGIRYSVSTITLYKVANGNFRSTSINANDI